MPLWQLERVRWQQGHDGIAQSARVRLVLPNNAPQNECGSAASWRDFDKFQRFSAFLEFLTRGQLQVGFGFIRRKPVRKTH